LIVDHDRVSMPPMKKTSLFAAMLVVGVAGAAEAGGQPGSVGAGAEYQINGLGGASINFDQGDFHVGGFLGFTDGGNDNDTTFGLGARFFYHVHSTAMSDFGIGGSFGLASLPEPPMDNDRPLAVFIEPSAQIRLFLASNVALSASLGVVIGVVDAEGVAITGQGIGGTNVAGLALGMAGGAGIHYYFF
jgi:hypothetical protein